MSAGAPPSRSRHVVPSATVSGAPGRDHRRVTARRRNRRAPVAPSRRGPPRRRPRARCPARCSHRSRCPGCRPMWPVSPAGRHRGRGRGRPLSRVPPACRGDWLTTRVPPPGPGGSIPRHQEGDRASHRGQHGDGHRHHDRTRAAGGCGTPRTVRWRAVDGIRTHSGQPDAPVNRCPRWRNSTRGRNHSSWPWRRHCSGNPGRCPDSRPAPRTGTAGRHSATTPGP